MTEQQKKELEQRQCERMCGNIFREDGPEFPAGISDEERAKRKAAAEHALAVFHELRRKNPNL